MVPSRRSHISQMEKQVYTVEACTSTCAFESLYIYIYTAIYLTKHKQVTTELLFAPRGVINHWPCICMRFIASCVIPVNGILSVTPKLPFMLRERKGSSLLKMWCPDTTTKHTDISAEVDRTQRTHINLMFH